MTAPLNLDWEAIKTLYAKGATLASLAKANNVAATTLRMRSSREKWTRLRNIAPEQPVTNQPDKPDCLKSQSAAVRSKLSDTIAASVSMLPKPRSWNHAAKLNREMLPLVANADKLYGWSDQPQQTLVSIGSLKAITIQSAPVATQPSPAQLEQSSPVIDMAPEPEREQSNLIPQATAPGG